MTARHLGTDLVGPVSLALVQSRLDHIARHMGWVMVRAARSPIFNQSHDFSCFITDADGTLLSQADGIPIHTGGGGFAVRALLGAFSGDIADGDAFLLNDPYLAGGNHLPDWVIARPVFAEGNLLAFACNRAHQSDIGGGAAGTYNPRATEIFHEGIRLPPLRLVERGRVREDLWRLLMANTRCPNLLDGDLRAMLGSVAVGAEELAEITTELGVAATVSHFRAVLDYADRCMRQLVSELPNGIYRSEERFHNDCFEAREIQLRLAVIKARDTLHFDFTGTDPQIKGFKNSSVANTWSAVYAGLASFFDADLPRNEGTFRCVRITAPQGTVVNASPPAPVTMCTVFPAHEIIHMVWWALGQAEPRRALAGWGKNCFPVTSGCTAEGGTWVMYNWGGNSGAGAATTRDGFNQMGPLVTLGGLVIPNAETYEQLYPVTVLRQEMRTDGGGAGCFRGGTGVVYEIEVHTDADYSFRGEGLDFPTGLGMRGGADGAAGELRIRPLGAVASDAAEMPAPFDQRRFGPSLLSMCSAGGGGFGDPLERPPEAVLRDVRDGLVSHEAAASSYGVALLPDGRTVDEWATRSLRQSLREARAVRAP